MVLRVLNVPDFSVYCVNKCINRCFGDISNFLYQKNIIVFHYLQTEKQLHIIAKNLSK